MEITTYLEKTLASELSTNVIDLCRWAALLTIPLARRAWELSRLKPLM